MHLKEKSDLVYSFIYLCNNNISDLFWQILRNELVEHWTMNREALGSIPLRGTVLCP